MEWYRTDKAAVALAIRRIRRHRQRELGSALVVLSVAGGSGVFSLEEVLDVLGAAPRENLLPVLAKPTSPDSPTSFLISKCLMQKIKP